MADRLWLWVMRLALRHCSNRAALRLHLIQKQWWDGAEGRALAARLLRGERG